MLHPNPIPLAELIKISSIEINQDKKILLTVEFFNNFKPCPFFNVLANVSQTLSEQEEHLPVLIMPSNLSSIKQNKLVISLDDLKPFLDLLKKAGFINDKKQEELEAELIRQKMQTLSLSSVSYSQSPFFSDSSTSTNILPLIKLEFKKYATQNLLPPP